MATLRNKVAMFEAEDWGLAAIYVLFGIGCCLYLLTDVQELLVVACLPSVPFLMWMLTRQFAKQMGSMLDQVQAEALKASDPKKPGPSKKP